MKTLVIMILACCFMANIPALADGPQTGTFAVNAESAAVLTAGALERAIAHEVARVGDSSFSSPDSDQTLLQQQNQANERSWIGRHPVIFGSLIGFGTGFAVGYAKGNPAARNDPSSDYLTPETKGFLYGGVGAGVGALVGWIIGR